MDEGSHDITEVRKIQKELEGLLEQDDLKWRQSAKKHWYKHGDRNTKYFHAFANQRKRKNRISQIYYEQRCKLTNRKDIEEAFNGYFEKLFLSSEPSQEELNDYLRTLKPRVTEEMNENLSKDFSKV